MESLPINVNQGVKWIVKEAFKIKILVSLDADPGEIQFSSKRVINLFISEAGIRET